MLPISLQEKGILSVLWDEIDSILLQNERHEFPYLWHAYEKQEGDQGLIAWQLLLLPAQQPFSVPGKT